MDVVSACEQTLVRRMSVESAADTLRIADMHDLEMLKRSSLDYITENVREVSETEGYISYLLVATNGSRRKEAS
jgi:hypothetical protein